MTGMTTRNQNRFTRNESERAPKARPTESEVLHYERRRSYLSIAVATTPIPWLGETLGGPDVESPIVILIVFFGGFVLLVIALYISMLSALYNHRLEREGNVLACVLVRLLALVALSVLSVGLLKSLGEVISTQVDQGCAPWVSGVFMLTQWMVAIGAGIRSVNVTAKMPALDQGSPITKESTDVSSSGPATSALSTPVSFLVVLTLTMRGWITTGSSGKERRIKSRR